MATRMEAEAQSLRLALLRQLSRARASVSSGFAWSVSPHDLSSYLHSWLDQSPSIRRGQTRPQATDDNGLWLDTALLLTIPDDGDRAVVEKATKELSREQIDQQLDEAVEAYLTVSKASKKSVGVFRYLPHYIALGDARPDQFSRGALQVEPSGFGSSYRAFSDHLSFPSPAFTSISFGIDPNRKREESQIHGESSATEEAPSTTRSDQAPNPTVQAARRATSPILLCTLSALGGAALVTTAGMALKANWISLDALIRAITTSVVPISLLVGGIYFYLEARAAKNDADQQSGQGSH